MKDPSIRFLDDNGKPYPDARRITFGDVYKERKERGNDSLQILSVSIHTGVSDQELDEENLGKEVRRSEDKSVYKRAESGDLVFNMMRAWQGAVGSVANTGMVSPAYIVAEPDESVDSVYIDYLVQTKRTIHEFNRLSYGVTDFRKRLYWESFTKVPLNLPSLDEQSKVAALFVELDKLISAASVEVSSLEKTRKGMMQKVFSQEVRFKREDGTGYAEWTVRSMGDLTVPHKVRNRNRLDLEIYSVNNLVGFLPQSEQFDEVGYLSNTDTSIYMIVPPNHFAYNPARINVGSIGYQNVGHDVQVSSLYEVFKTTEEVEDQFLWYWFHTDYFNKMVQRLQEGGVRLYYYYDKLAETDIYLPSVEEQQKIAAFFSSMDDVIAAAKDELQGYKELKKYLLQNMFA